MAITLLPSSPVRNAEDLLEELAATDESARIEAKRGRQIDRSIMETVCAFANEPGLGGGYLLLGVSRSERDLFGGGYEVTGVKDPDQLQSDLASQCATSLNMPLRPQMRVEPFNGRNVLVVYVPEAAAVDKPVYLKNLGLPRGAFRRSGSTDHEGTEDDLIVLYAGRQMETHDAAVVADADLDDIDENAVEDYRRLRREANPQAEELDWHTPELLRALGCVKKRDGVLKPTVAGILLFGSVQALRRCFPMMRVDYIRVPGRSWVEDPDHRFDTLEIRAPLVTAIRRAASTVADDLLKSFSLPEGELTRRDELILPMRVIREAVTNAVMHRSYRINGTVQIIRYANRLELRNPGHSLKAEEQLGEPGSETRNPVIAAVLHELNLAETKGSGIRAMRELMHANDLLPPHLESSRRPDQFVATFLFHHFLQEDDLVWLRGLTDQKLSDEEARALVFVREVGAIDNYAYREINRTDTLNASTHLRRLRDLGLLEMKGRGSLTYYEPAEGFTNAGAVDGEGANKHQQGENTHQSGADKHQLEPNKHQLEPGEASNDSGLGETSEAERLYSGLPVALRNRLPPPGSKPRSEQVFELITDLCAWQPLNARQLAQLLGRGDVKALVRSYLTPMLENGQLEYTHPEMPNHPRQQYRAPGTDS